MKNHVVYLLVGPRGSGKSVYAEKKVKENPTWILISRDAILVEVCGSEHTDPYTGANYHAMEILHSRIKEKLSAETAITIILDCWTGNSSERQSLIRKLRAYGATRVIALFLTTELSLVEQWFWKKPGIAKMKDMIHLQRKGLSLSFYGEDAPKRDFQLFYELAKKINDDGFDEVIRVNPLET